MKNDLSILIATSDGYLNYVPNSISLLEKYFEPATSISGSCGSNITIVGETEQIEINSPNKLSYEWVLPGKDGDDMNWGGRMQIGLEKIETKYTFFILEDYYLSQKLSRIFIRYLLDFMQNNNAKKLLLSPIPHWVGGPKSNYENPYVYADTVDTIRRMSPTSFWLTSIQPAIWKTDHLLKLMNKHYDPWEFEVLGSQKLQILETEDSHYVLQLPPDNPIYFNLVRRGNNLSPGALEFLEKEGLSL